MTLPPSDFAASFRASIVPRLRPLIDTQALFLALDMTTFADAETEIIRAAGKWGAYRLPPEHFAALGEWVATALVTAEARHMARIDAEKPECNRRSADITAWDRRVRAWAAKATADA